MLFPETLPVLTTMRFEIQTKEATLHLNFVSITYYVVGTTELLPEQNIKIQDGVILNFHLLKSSLLSKSFLPIRRLLFSPQCSVERTCCVHWLGT